MMANDPDLFKEKYRNITQTYHRHQQTYCKGTYFFDYGNAFLLEASRLVLISWPKIISTSSIQATFKTSWVPCVLILSFSPFRWVCAGKPEDLAKTDAIACAVLEEMAKTAPIEIQQQMQITFNGSRAQEKQTGRWLQARILYADAEGRVKSRQSGYCQGK
jgi:urocanate hydratase